MHKITHVGIKVTVRRQSKYPHSSSVINSRVCGVVMSYPVTSPQDIHVVSLHSDATREAGLKLTDSLQNAVTVLTARTQHRSTCSSSSCIFKQG